MKVRGNIKTSKETEVNMYQRGLPPPQLLTHHTEVFKPFKRSCLLQLNDLCVSGVVLKELRRNCQALSEQRKYFKAKKKKV